ncbi:hypothetical protein [Siminovitchia fordii]|uniref:Uncharacterized protein n=1 Tax=Siminovitchia fordii TaxID=254759 RepID=A0ABQ4KA72_9BACI|nr:hypothetical protein [Siminovitchia fordii]GIN22624.1 hypothetical protein J1TS3_37580 [Siminovitchia fordii]
MRNEKILLIVDLEEAYLTDDDYMGLIMDEYWNETRDELRSEYEKVINKAIKLKEDGWKIHFTGQTSPFGKLNEIVDVILPHWESNKDMIASYYKSIESNITVGGIFYERCVNAVSKIIKGSTLSKEHSISHYIIGDDEDYFYEFEY